MALSLRQSITANTLSVDQGGPAVIELQDKLTTEETRAKAAEAVNRAAIITEETRAKLVEAATNLQVESANSSLAGEITRAVSADSVLDQRITTEIAAEVVRASAEEALLASAGVTERTRALVAEAFLQAGVDGLNQEAQAIITGGDVLSTKITEETARALTAEAFLQAGVDGLNQETQAIITAGGALNDAMSVEVSEETARAMTAENAIQAQLVLENIHYGFRVCGTTYQNCNNGDILVFDNKTRTDYGCHVVPTATAYDITTFKYTVEIDGYYFIGLSLFMNTNLSNSDIRFGMYVNNAAYAFGGKYVGTGENVSLNMPCVQGDVIDCRCYIGPATVSLNPGHSYFYGWKIN